MEEGALLVRVSLLVYDFLPFRHGLAHCSGLISPDETSRLQVTIWRVRLIVFVSLAITLLLFEDLLERLRH